MLLKKSKMTIASQYRLDNLLDERNDTSTEIVEATVFLKMEIVQSFHSSSN